MKITGWLRKALLIGLAIVTNYVMAMPVDLQDKQNNPIRLYDKSKALLIGNSKYVGAWNALSDVQREMDELKNALLKQGFESDDIEIKRNLTADQTFQAVSSFLSRDSGPKTRALVYISGHGWTDSKGEGFFVGVDSTSTSGVGREGLLSLGVVRELYRSTTALHTLIVLDSCYSGALLETRSQELPRRIYIEQIQNKAFHLLASGTSVQRVPGASIFLQHFIAGINGSAALDYGKTFLTFRHLAVWLKDEVSSKSNQTPVSADYPVPGGEMVFVIRPGVEIESASISTNKPNSTGTISKPPEPTRSIPLVVTAAAQEDASIKATTISSEEFSRRFPSTDVFYYRKSADSLTVVDALNKIGAKYVARPPELSNSLITNAIGCGQATSIEAVQELAISLLKAGIKIQRISPYINQQAKSGRIEVFSTTWVKPDAPLLTEPMIKSLKNCTVLINKGKS